MGDDSEQMRNRYTPGKRNKVLRMEFLNKGFECMTGGVGRVGAMRRVCVGADIPSPCGG